MPSAADAFLHSTGNKGSKCLGVTVSHNCRRCLVRGRSGNAAAYRYGFEDYGLLSLLGEKESWSFGDFLKFSPDLENS